MKNKKIIKTISLNEVSYLREEIIDGIFDGNWYDNLDVLLLSICRLHEIGYRKIGNFDDAIKWQINAQKL